MFLVGLLPESSGLPIGIENAISDAVGMAYAFDFIVPIDTVLTLLGLVTAFEIGILTYRFIMWIIHLVRGN